MVRSRQASQSVVLISFEAQIWSRRSTHHFVVEALELTKLDIVEPREIRSLADLVLMRHALSPVHGGRGAWRRQ